MKYSKILLSILALSLISTVAFSDASDLIYKRITDLTTWTGVPATGDRIVIYDRSDNRVEQANAMDMPIMVDSLVLNQDAESVTTTNVITVDENKRTYYLQSTTAFVSTLPAPASGLTFEFVIKTDASSGGHTIVTALSANIILGGFTTADVNTAGGDVDWEETGGDTITFVSANAVVGDRVRCTSDGTSWYCEGLSKAYNALTITTAS